MALLEAMACGVTPVVSDVGGNTEVVDDGDNGLIVPPKNAKRLAEKIEWCMSNPGELARMGTNAVKTINEKFSIERTAHEYIESYRSAIDKARQRPEII